MKGIDSTVDHIQNCRWEAVRALQAHNSSSATLKVTCDLIQFGQPDRLQSSTSLLNHLIHTQAILAFVGAVKSRSVWFAEAIRSGHTRWKLLTLMQTDLMTVLDSFLELESLVEVTATASAELCRTD